MWNYSDKVFDHFMNPRNVGEVENPDGVGEVGSMACGDALRLGFKLDEEGCIAEAKFQTFGCGSAIASSSILTEMIKGKTLAEAAKITNEDIARELDGLPREKMHCSVMGREALEAAMIDHYKRLGRGVPCDLLIKSSIICNCFQVEKTTAKEAIMNHRLETLEDVTNFTKAGGGCGECHHDLNDLLRDCWAEMEGDSDPVPKGSGGLISLGEISGPPKVEFSPKDAEIVARIQEHLDNEISLALRNDGGDIEFVRYRDSKVFVRLTGACAACRASDATIKGYVQAQLREFIAAELEVIEVNK
ncbi:MAG: Fe-S cluster assembly protein NifU [Gemmatimonadales bacterium]|nr:Fe-S cluster assembly protein NifU [Gemmatimonadales bacterium]